MNHFLESIEQRILELRKIIREKEAALGCAPEGLINIAVSGKRIQYYYKKNSSDTTRKYLKKEEKQKIEALCQKDYDEKVLMLAQKELEQLEHFKKKYSEYTYEDVYENLNPYRKIHVKPDIVPDEEFIKNWEQLEYQRKSFQEDMPEYYTDKGERVRSKTEILIANALLKYHIPYRYESPLYLNGYGKIHPDFTVLNVRLRKEYYWEHMGKMDDQEYAEEALRRIDMYERNDIFPGDTLILTHETLKYPLNSRNIEKMILKYLV